MKSEELAIAGDGSRFKIVRYSSKPTLRIFADRRPAARVVDRRFPRFFDLAGKQVF